jgi:NAD(P)H-nitrite reductase large subunit
VRLLTSSPDAARYSVTLITARPFFVWYPSTIRLVTSEKHNIEDQLFLPYDGILGSNGRLVVGTAVSIEKRPTKQGGEVVLHDGQRVPYDVLVVAPGSKREELIDFPETEAEREAFIARSRVRIQAAKRIVLAGGGAVGLGKEVSRSDCHLVADSEVHRTGGGNQGCVPGNSHIASRFARHQLKHHRTRTHM